MATVRSRNYTLDTELELMAAGLIAATAAGSLKLDLGDAMMEGDVLVDVSALEIASNDETYQIVAQFSPDLAFTAATIMDGSQLSLSAKELKTTDSNRDDIVGRYIIPVRNEFAGTVFRYMRLYTIVAGTIATGINYTAYLCKRKGGT